jgi:XTP/dITP diphosphohydrolase
MLELIFATNNQNKVIEVQSLMDKNILVKSLLEAGIDIDIPEPHQTLEENAVEKSSTIHRLFGKNCFSEDTGLEIDALGGAPGVKSARFAGENSNAQANIDLVLSKMTGIENRTAQFRTVICLIWKNQTYYFEGVCKGQILTNMQGENGFGYDPIFVPDGASKSFANMTMDEKNQFSHRKKAVSQLFEFLGTV